ncbi:MAG: hypothetical protein ACT4OV_02735 [Microthrixaceae bacterium]
MTPIRAAEASPAASAPTPPVLFVHVMKTGGTSVMRTLRETFALSEIYPRATDDLRYENGALDIAHHLSVPYLLSLSEERTASIRVYIGHFPYVVRELMGVPMRAATVLREPVARTVSLLRQIKRQQPWEDEPATRRPVADLPLEEVYEHPRVFAPLIQNHQTKIFSMTPDDDPQSYMDVVEVDAARLARARTNLEEVDVLGVMEHFDWFVDDLEAAFSWKVVRSARKNVTPDEDLGPVSPSLLKRIASDNALDIELYERARDLVELRHRRVGS